MHTHRTKPKKIEWYNCLPSSVIDEFDDAQGEFEFRMKLNGSKVFCHVIKGEYANKQGWYVLMQLRDNKQVVKVSLQRFRQSIPPRLQHLAAKFDEWYEHPKTDKSEFVSVDFVEYLSDLIAERLTGDKPLSLADLKKLKNEKQKQVDEDFEARKKAKKSEARWDAVPRGRRGPGAFAGMCA
jgi:hypothetical protein